ncbi:unnamed protein product [Camellia sinensis]
MESETLTLILVNLASIMDMADQSLLPAVYKEVGAALHIDPTGLGSLTLFRSIVQSACYPLAAYLAVHHNRTHIIALGAFLWAAATFLVAISSTFFEVAVWRGLNGIGLAIVTPAILSLVADSTDETNRGMAFGWLHLTGYIGSIIGGLSAVLMASTSFMGIRGWRIAFHLVALISVIVGILVRLFANDPHFSDSNAQAQIPRKPFWSELKDLVKEAKSVIKIPSFQIIVAQGIPGSFPGSALSFAPMWLELIGFSHQTVALLWTLYIVARSLGGLFGGKMGDILAQRFQNSGRIILAQISSISSVPLAAILLLVLPDDPSTALMHGLVLFIMGFFNSWCATATNKGLWGLGGVEVVPAFCSQMEFLRRCLARLSGQWDTLLVEKTRVLTWLNQHWGISCRDRVPIFAEIVPERSRTSIYALDRSFETIISSFAPPVVGILAQHVFGYKPIRKGSTGSEEIETDRENAAPLAKALYTAIGFPFVICCLIYSFLYCTYPRDRKQAKMHALIESEMQRIENPSSAEECSQLLVSE